jgi:hypothetical protein
MGKFSDKTKKWLRSIIKQRKLLIHRNASHKDQAVAAVAIYSLESLLNCYPYENDVYMARFIRQYSTAIENILPGKGSTCYEKRMKEFSEIKKQALMLEAKLSDCINKVISNKKIENYEMAF